MNHFIYPFWAQAYTFTAITSYAEIEVNHSEEVIIWEVVPAEAVTVIVMDLH